MTEYLHATAVAVDGRALLIVGPSGSGKSSLAIEMIALGAELIADDTVAVTAENGKLLAAAPPEARAEIEARYVGILACASRPGATPIDLILDLGEEEPNRLPFVEQRQIGSGSARLLKRAPALSASALVLALRSGGPVDPDSEDDDEL